MPERTETWSASPAEAPAAPARPRLIYDGDCGFCFYWARYWAKLTGDRVEYRPYQQVLSQYPAIPEAEFKRAVQFIAPDGRRASAAEASFLTLAQARGKGFWLALYRRLPGFAPISELAYAFIAHRRGAFFRLSLILWGRDPEPPRYELVSFLFLRLFGLIALCAFISFAVQAQGLIGSRGILPLSELVDALGPRLGAARFVLVPMVFWLNDSDLAISAVCWAGAVVSLMLVLGLLPRVSLRAHLCALSVAALCRTDLHGLPVGHVPVGDHDCRAPHELQADDRRVARALASVPLHIHVGSRQADQRRSQLARSLGALLPLPDPAAADAARLVCGPGALGRAESRDWSGALHRARSAVRDLLPAAPEVRLGGRDPAPANRDFPDRELQLVQSSDHAALPRAVRRRGAQADRAVPPSRGLAGAGGTSGAAAGGDDRRQRHRGSDGVREPHPDGRAFRRQPARAGRRDRPTRSSRSRS